MTARANKCKLEPVDGVIRCPCCGAFLLRVLPSSAAVDLPLYCRKCGIEYVTNIDVCQSPLRPEPRELSEPSEA